MTDGLDPQLVLLAWLGSFGVGVATVTTLILNGFKKNRDVFWKALSRHERYDERRFASIGQQLWQIQFRNSRKDGTRPPPAYQAMAGHDEEDEDAEEGSDSSPNVG